MGVFIVTTLKLVMTNISPSIITKDPPVFTTKPLPYYQKSAGDNLTIPCSAEGDPNPIVAWRRKQGVIISDGRVKVVEGNLTLTLLEGHDEGTYECVATNVVMSIVTPTILVVLRANEKTQSYRLTHVPGQGHVVLSWLPPFHHDRGRHLFIWYQLVGGKQDWQVMSLSGVESNSVPIYGLQSNTTYQFVLHSTTNSGREIFHPHPLLVHTEPIMDEKSWSDDSTRGDGHVSNVRDPDQDSNYRPSDPKLHPPTNLTASYWSHSGINITWSHPPDQSAPAYYIIEYKTVGKWVNLTEKPVSGHVTSYHWRTPSRGTIYHFRLVGVDGTMTRFSQPSQEFAVKTFADPDDASYWRPSSSVIVALVALVVGSILALSVLVFIVNYVRRIRRKKRLPYGHVKYSGANETTRESSPNSNLNYSRRASSSAAFAPMISLSASQASTASAAPATPSVKQQRRLHEATVVANTHPFDHSRHVSVGRPVLLNHRYHQDFSSLDCTTAPRNGAFFLQSKTGALGNQSTRPSPEKNLVETLI